MAMLVLIVTLEESIPALKEKDNQMFQAGGLHIVAHPVEFEVGGKGSSLALQGNRRLPRATSWCKHKGPRPGIVHG